MPIDVERALGAALPTTEFSWDEDRVILYHLGVGAGDPPTDPGELEYCYEANLKVLPSFATIPPFASMINVGGIEGLDINLAMVLHGEQDLTLAGAMPTAATVSNEAKIAAIYDKKKAAVVVVEVTSRDAGTGRELFTNRASLFVRGEGGWGGDPGPASEDGTPDREPDAVFSSPTLPQQALLYRLSGDKNPLHADPNFAALGGFDRPILHGLCTYGVVCKAVVDGIFGGDVAAVSRYRARFAGIVYPGETVLTRVWDEGDRVVVEASTEERGAPVITNAAIWKT